MQDLLRDAADRTPPHAHGAVGKCDDVVWRFPRSVQDAYYPFMDNLHTDMTFERFGYSDEDVRAALDTAASASPSVAERLVLVVALNRNAVLYTVNPRLMGHAGQSVRTPPICGEASFPDGLERLYHASLALRVPSEGR